MNIRTTLTLRFTAIVATILIIFSLAVYILSADYRREDFYARLESRAITTARLLVTVKEVDNKLLRIIDQNSIHALFQEKVLVFDEKNNLVYSSLDDLPVNYSTWLINEIRRKKKIEYTRQEVESVGIVFQNGDEEYVVISSAFDRYGRSKLKNLRNVLWTGLFVGILIIIITGIIFAGQVVRPLALMNAEVSSISAGNLSLRIDEGNRRDEIAQLAMNFNSMLLRLESAFEIQQQFVSNASHELRNPLAAITSQLQLTLGKVRTPEEYQRVMQSLLDDTRTLVELTNGLLTLAQSGVEKQRFKFNPVRIDETLFAAQDELGKAQPGYHFLFEYDMLPDDDSMFIIAGNEHLLKTAFLNLMDNACKFSEDHTVRMRFSANARSIDISFIDNGIGIPEPEQEKIFIPFHRAQNAQPFVKGYGIGLSLSRRIIQLHDGNITLRSEPGKGSCFRVSLPH